MKQAACLLLINPQSNLIRVVTRRNSDILSLPGGKVDPGETFVQAALRETKEETGVDLKESDVSFLYSAVCNSDVEGVPPFDTQTFVAYSDVLDTQGIESGISTRLVTWDELLSKTAFLEYNTAVKAASDQFQLNQTNSLGM